MRTKALIVISLIFFSSFSSPVAADRGMGSIDLSANPVSVVADGKSVSTITAQVRGSDGRFIADGTEIRFSSSLGIIDDVVTTSAGVARARLISSDIPGNGIVTASWAEGQAVAQVTVEFAEEGLAETGTRYVQIDADDYLAYSLDYKLIDAVGNVKVRYRHIEVDANTAQLDVDTGRLVARSVSRDEPVRFETAGGVIEADMLVCDIFGSQALVLSREHGRVLRVNFSHSTLEISEEQVIYAPEDFDFVDTYDSSILVSATRATVIPYDKIQFRRASVYVGGSRVLSLPLYVVSLTEGLPTGDSQYIGYSTRGITVNLPLYYMLTPASSGALLVRHGDSTGWGDYGRTPGWYVDLQQKYSSERSDGTFVLSQITGRDWGAHFTHSQDFGDRTHGYLYLDYPSHRDLYGNMNISKQFDDLSVGLNMFGGMYRDLEDSLSTDLSIRTRPKQIGDMPLRYTLSSTTAYSTGSSLRSGGLSESLQGNIYTTPLPIADKLTLRSSLGLGYVMGNSITSGVSTVGTAMVAWEPSRYNRLQLSYRYANRPSIYTTQTARQTLSGTWHLSDASRKWRLYLYGIKGIGDPTESLFADLSYRFDDDWRLGVRATWNRFATNSYNDLELSVGRRIGNHELVTIWSQSQNKVMFELGSAAF